MTPNPEPQTPIPDPRSPMPDAKRPMPMTLVWRDRRFRDGWKGRNAAEHNTFENIAPAFTSPWLAKTRTPKPKPRSRLLVVLVVSIASTPTCRYAERRGGYETRYADEKERLQTFNGQTLHNKASTDRVCVHTRDLKPRNKKQVVGFRLLGLGCWV